MRKRAFELGFAFSVCPKDHCFPRKKFEQILVSSLHFPSPSTIVQSPSSCRPVETREYPVHHHHLHTAATFLNYWTHRSGLEICLSPSLCADGGVRENMLVCLKDINKVICGEVQGGIAVIIACTLCRTSIIVVAMAPKCGRRCVSDPVSQRSRRFRKFGP